MRLSFLFPFLLLAYGTATAQSLPEDCKLRIGTNLSGLADYGTELPFVDLMHNCRTWYSKDVDNPSGGPFDSGHADSLTYRPDGYPTHLPQSLPGVAFPQTVATIWAITDGWPAGTYTVLFDGTGSLSFWGGYSNLQQASPNRITFDFKQPVGSVLEMRIVSSAAADPVRNIRVLMPGTEASYQSQPFNPTWLQKLADFESVRFMDWFSTNHWGQPDPWASWDDPALFDWPQRQQLDHYTWATSKGIPYEMAIRLMNDYDLDGWVCVPHRASDEYIRQMATLFRDQLEPERHLTVEYSNETWNWIFGQAQWLNKYGCVQKGLPWPEGTVPYMQNCLDIWSTVYGTQLQRLTRVVGVQTGWQDVSNRTVLNMKPGTLDAFACTYYFGLSEEADAALDALGTQATATDIAYWARKSRENEKQWIRSQQQHISMPLQLPMVFYEGGQHLTPHPFGQEPTYAQALLDIQRDTAMYHLYTEWYDFVRSLQSGSKPLQLMNFSFVGNRSARYGSWGILETMDQDLSQVPAPKYRATLEQIQHYRTAGCDISRSSDLPDLSPLVHIYPNPTAGGFVIESPAAWTEARLYDALGRQVAHYRPAAQPLSLQGLPDGMYWIEISGEKNGQHYQAKLVKQ